jgi:hypothetical protein
MFEVMVRGSDYRPHHEVDETQQANAWPAVHEVVPTRSSGDESSIGCATPRSRSSRSAAMADEIRTLDVRKYMGRGYAHLEQLPNDSWSVIWLRHGEKRGSRLT